MDSHHFDTLVKHLYVLKSRREGLRALFAGLTASVLWLPASSDAADCQGKGQSCEKNEDCCSRICRFSGFRQREDGQTRQERAGHHGIAAERRGKKGKRGRKCKRGGKGRTGTERQNTCKGGKKGTCDCSRLKDRCNVASDCCFDDQACEANGCAEHTVCCTKKGDPCADDCDCCGARSFCDEESGRCDDCGEKKFTQEGPCTNDEDCCFDEDTCASIAPTCEDRQGDKQCCAKPGGACEEHCDCCFPFFCDEDLGQCVGPGSFCPPDEVACLIPNPKKSCCPEDSPHCCDEGAVAGCCAEGFPVCCDHENPPGVGCCQADFKCCEPGDKQLCCPEDQVCCPSRSDIPCANDLEECLDA